MESPEIKVALIHVAAGIAQAFASKVQENEKQLYDAASRFLIAQFSNSEKK